MLNEEHELFNKVNNTLNLYDVELLIGDPVNSENLNNHSYNANLPPEVIKGLNNILSQAYQYQKYYPVKLNYFLTETVFPIPIFISEDEFVSYDETWKDIELDGKDGYKPTGTVLGRYTHKSDVFSGNYPHIILYRKAIEAEAKEGKIDVNLLYKVVIIHELAHAMMDKYLDDDIFPRTIYAKAMEESLANCITLKWFDEYDHSNYCTIRKWMSGRQPTIYKFGINQYDAKVDWIKWRISSKQMNALKKWFDSNFENGDLKSSLPDMVKKSYIKVFRNPSFHIKEGTSTKGYCELAFELAKLLIEKYKNGKKETVIHMFGELVFIGSCEKVFISEKYNRSINQKYKLMIENKQVFCNNQWVPDKVDVLIELAKREGIIVNPV